MADAVGRGRWFFPDWPVFRERLPFLWMMVMLGPVSGLLTGETITLRRLVVQAGIVGAVALVTGIGILFVDGFRASRLAVRPGQPDSIPWSSIVDARRKGTLLKMLVPLGANGALVVRELRVNRAFAAAVTEWLPAAHPLRSAIESPDFRPPSTIEQTWPIADGATLRESRSTIGWCFASLALIGGVGASTLLFWDRWSGPLLTVLYVPIVLFLAYCVIEAIITHYVIEVPHLRYRTSLGRGTFAWVEIASIDYSDRMRWLVLRTPQGKRLFVSTTVIGIPLLARALLQRCINATITPRARRMLQDYADGFQPTIWKQEVDW